MRYRAPQATALRNNTVHLYRSVCRRCIGDAPASRIGYGAGRGTGEDAGSSVGGGTDDVVGERFSSCEPPAVLTAVSVAEPAGEVDDCTEQEGSGATTASGVRSSG